MRFEKYSASAFELARLGDENALRDLLIEAQPDIRRYAKRNCFSADIDDAVQETLWVLSKRIGTVKMLASLPAWLFTIAKRECYRMAQRSKANSIVHHAEDIHEYQDDILLSSKPEHELRYDLTRAIHSLPDHYKHIVLLRDVEGMAIEEIAHRLGKSRDSVKGQLYRARMLVREHLI
ncbi:MULTISPECIES: RNA polymerase sigma factor [Vibrio]|nr:MULTISPECIES: sigma-70 family RNA polymerase sigma factor [Vibrio]KLN65191.1 hypothetical protein ZX61_10545 [Vibrio sp. VPAP30]